MDGMLDSLWDSGWKVTEKFSSVRAGVTSLSDDKAFLKLRYFMLECEKTKSKSNFFSRKDLVLKAGVSANDSIDEVSRILGKKGILGLTLKVDTLLDAEGLGRGK